MGNRFQQGPRLRDYFLGRRRPKATFLDKIDQTIDWQPIQTFPNWKLKRKANAVGNLAYPTLAMFKVFLL